MTNLKFSFVHKDGEFCLCCTVKGTSTRHYRVVKGLINPNFNKWNRKEQLFIDPSQDAIHNNSHLAQIKQYWESIYSTAISHGEVLRTGKQLFEYESKAKEIQSQDSFTLGGFLSYLINEMKNPQTKIPSKNYQNYIAILHKLEDHGNLLDIPVSEITDKHFEMFGEYLRKECNGVNYIKLMKRFRAVINKAREKKLTDATLYYDFIKDIPKSTNDHRKAQLHTKDGVDILSVSQMAKFESLDLSLIKTGGPRRMYYKELYRDFCIFMYETKIRPCDIVKLKITDIQKSRDNEYFSFVPSKKKNYVDSRKALQQAPITQKARSIVEKYRGQSSQGYIFPFAMNNYEWDFDNTESFANWYTRKQKQIQDINAFLQKVKSLLKVSKLTTYTLRHSSFTHEIHAGKKNIIQIAKEGGTSVKMLEQHYFNHLCKD